MKKIVIGFGMDLLIAAVLLGGIYWVNYRMPQKGIAAVSYTHLDVYKRQVILLANFL